MQEQDAEEQIAAPGGPGATHTFDQLAVQKDALLGQIVGNYHLLARVGEGAFGVVYRARDIRLDRMVAVKFLTVQQTDAAKRRFEQEARALARLGRHPGVVDIHAWGEHDGRCYLALEYLPESAAARLARHADGLALDTVLQIGVQCAEALAAAHRAGIIHGDIKPSNILLSDGVVHAKLCDFGLASLGLEHTLLGGSPAFLAPECAAGSPATQATDIYALGATLYTLLAGVPPIASRDPAEALHDAAAGRLRPLSEVRPGLPRPVYQLLRDAMALEPAQRPGGAEAFAVALRACMAGPGPGARTARRRVTRFSTALAALAVAVVAMVFGPSLLPGGGGSVLLADARLNLNQGNYAAARAGFEHYLDDRPDNTEARYGLAYALLLEGDQQQAAEEFAQIGEAAMQSEGQAAVAYMASGEAARPALERAADAIPHGYPAVMLAMLDMMGGDFSQAKAHLDGVQEQELRFDWQRRQYLQTLGQLYYKSGDYKAAEATFGRLEQTSAGAAPAVTTDYLALARERSEAADHSDVGERIARLKGLLAGTPAAAVTDAWTSRPLPIWILPVDARQGLIMQESGLADILPWRLSRALLGDTTVPLTPVDRENVDAVLAEQELSATLSERDKAVQLGRVVGARLLLEANVHHLFNQELLHLSLVDTETTRLAPVGEYEVTRDLDTTAWFNTIQHDLIEAVEQAYPLRGRIVPESSEIALNLGTAVGVVPGMRFQVLPAAEQPALPGITAVVRSVRDADHSTVELEGSAATAVPAGGWLVERSSPLEITTHAP